MINKKRSMWTRLARALGPAASLTLVAFGTPPLVAGPTADPRTVEERIARIRERLFEPRSQAEPAATTASAERPTITQWGNWNNWRNAWSNWGNWRNGA